MRIPQTQTVAHLDAEHAQHRLRLALRTAEHQHQVARTGLNGRSDRLKVFRRIELVDRRLECAVFADTQSHQTLRTDLRTLHPFGEFVSLLAGIARCTRDSDGAHIFSILEDTEPVALHQRGDLVDLHPETDVRLVAAIIVHRVEPAHPRNLRRDLHTDDLLEEVAHHSLEHVEHVLLLHEAHLAVDLRELRLRKQRTIWKYRSYPATISSCLNVCGLCGKA